MCENPKKLTVMESFVSNQCFLDIQLPCHFVVLLIVHFRNRYPHLSVPLHLIGSNSCEIFFSKNEEMVEMERAYDFSELLNCATIEYRENGLKFGHLHNKTANVWADLHPLQEGQSLADLEDYSGICAHEDVIATLTEGFTKAQSILEELNMITKHVQPRRLKGVTDVEANWFQKPWAVEALDPQNLAYIPTSKSNDGEDGNALVVETPTSMVDVIMMTSPMSKMTW